ncbi:MAG: sulfate/thiosulfate ABC transporter permease CysW, partial [Oxalobacteraceae bacterium]
MSAVATPSSAPMARVEPAYTPSPIAEPFWVRATLIAIALTFMTLFLFVPLVAVFVEAFKKGWQVYLTSITEPDAISAIKLTLLT